MIRRLLTLLAFAGLAAASLPAAEEKPAATEPAPKTTAEKPAKPKKKVVAPADASSSSGKARKAKVMEKMARQGRAEKAAAKLTPTQAARLLDLVNTGDAKALQAMPEIGEVRAKAIQKARPFPTVAALAEVDGIGEVTFDGIIAWTKKGMKTEATATAPETKTTAPKPAAKATESATPKKAAKKSAS